jgi:hypothetical protein
MIGFARIGLIVVSIAIVVLIGIIVDDIIVGIRRYRDS